MNQYCEATKKKKEEKKHTSAQCSYFGQSHCGLAVHVSIHQTLIMLHSAVGEYWFIQAPIPMSASEGYKASMISGSIYAGTWRT